MLKPLQQRIQLMPSYEMICIKLSISLIDALCQFLNNNGRTQTQLILRYYNFVLSICRYNKQMFEHSQSVNKDQLFSAIEQSRRSINPIKSDKAKHVVIVQGYSGVGKSSLILTLSGQKILGYQHPISRTPILMNQDKDGFKGIRIEEEIIAGTIHPAWVSMPEPIGDGEEIVLWDMPGIGENRGLTQSLINSYYYMTIFQSQHSVKIAFAITHGDIHFGNKGQNLSNVFGDFLKMFGDIQFYQKSIVLVITKAPSSFSSEDAALSFNKIKELPIVKDNQMMDKLVGKLSDGSIPIIIFSQPDLSNSVSKQSAIDVTPHYRNFIRQFYKIATSLAPSKQFRLIATAMSSEEADKCLGFALKIRDEISINTKFVCQNLTKYIIQCCPKLEIYSTANQIKQRVDFIITMRRFVYQFNTIIEIVPNQRKEELKERFYQLDKLFVNYSITPLNPQREIQCPCMTNLNHNYTIINFLNLLNFHKNKAYYWIDQACAMKFLFDELANLKIDKIWQEEIENAFKQQTNNIVLAAFERHLNGWANSQLYYLWKNSYRYFPSFALRLSKFPRSDDKDTIYARAYFKEIQAVEENIDINTQQIRFINDILEYSQTGLNLQMDPQFVTDRLAPMLVQKQQTLINNVIVYKDWSKEYVNQVMDYYSNLHGQYRKEDRLSQSAKMINPKLFVNQTTPDSFDERKLHYLIEDAQKKNKVLDQAQSQTLLLSRILNLQENLLVVNKQLDTKNKESNKNNKMLQNLRKQKKTFEINLKLVKQTLQESQKYKKIISHFSLVLIILVSIIGFIFWRKLNQANQQIVMYKHANEELIGKWENGNLQLKKLSELNQALQINLANYIQRFSKEKELNEALTANLSELIQEQKQKKDVIENLTILIENLTQGWEKEKEANEILTVKLDRHYQLKELEKQSKLIKAELDDCSYQLKESEEFSKVLQDQFDVRTHQLIDMRVSSEALTNRFTKLTSILKKDEEQIVVLTGKTASLIQELKIQKELKEGLKVKIENITSERSNDRKTIQALQSQLSLLNSQLHHFKQVSKQLQSHSTGNCSQSLKQSVQNQIDLNLQIANLEFTVLKIKQELIVHQKNEEECASKLIERQRRLSISRKLNKEMTLKIQNLQNGTQDSKYQIQNENKRLALMPSFWKSYIENPKQIKGNKDYKYVDEPINSFEYFKSLHERKNKLYIYVALLVLFLLAA